MKTCSKCGCEKPVSEFALRNNSKDGLTGQCKACLNKKHQKHRDLNVDAVREQAREWRKRNAHHVAQNLIEWRKEKYDTGRWDTAIQQSRYLAKAGGYMPCLATAEEVEAGL